MWVPIPGWSARYEINAYGEVRSLDMTVGARNGKTAVRIGRKLALARNTNGYAVVTLTNGTDRPQFLVHRLVARTFLGECPQGLFVLHTDGDKTNNHYLNLKYGTQAENVADTGRHGHQLRGAEHPMAKLDVDAVKVIRGSSKSGPELARLFAVTSAHIWSVRHNRCWKHVV